MSSINTIVEGVKNYLESNNNIGCFVSGGFDSTTLCYLIFKITHEHNLKNNITIYTVPRLDDSIRHAKRVLTWASGIFPSVRYSHEYIGNPYLAAAQQVFSGVITVFMNTDKCIISSDTRVPEELRHEHAPPRTFSPGPRVFMPFINYDKTITLELAQELGILQEISEVSHTCTESKELRCNRCWQCKERAWAFAKLDIHDIGTR